MRCVREEEAHENLTYVKTNALEKQKSFTHHTLETCPEDTKKHKHLHLECVSRGTTRNQTVEKKHDVGLCAHDLKI